MLIRVMDACVVAPPDLELAPTLQEVSERCESPRRTRVLVVEDEPMIRHFVALALQRYFGCDIDRAENGVEAKALLQVREYALIVSDLRMAHLDGIELHRWIRGALPGMVNRIVLMTGYAREHPLDVEIALWQIPVLTKPFGLDTLQRVCAPYLARNVRCDDASRP